MEFDFEIMDEKYYDDSEKRRQRLEELRTSILMKDWKLNSWRRVEGAPIGVWCRRPIELLEITEYAALMYFEQSELAHANFGNISDHDHSLDKKVIKMLDELAEEKTVRELINVLGWNRYEQGTRTERETMRQAIQDTLDAGRLVSVVMAWERLDDDARTRATQTSILLERTFKEEAKKRGLT